MVTTSTSRAAYSDCEELLDKVLEKGRLRVGYTTKGEAQQLYTRLQYFRVLDREETTRIYEPDDPRHGVSAYDPLIIRAPKNMLGEWWVLIEPRQITGRIEELAAE